MMVLWDFGSYELGGFNATNKDSTTADLTDEEVASDAIENLAGAALAADRKWWLGESSSLGQLMEKLNSIGFDIPLVNDPIQVVKLLLGFRDIDLLTYRMPGMELDASIRQEFPIYPGITGVLEGGLGGFANFGFGFDNNGLLDWADHDFRLAESARVFDGFYIADKHLDDNGNLVDLPELGLSATMGAGGGLNAAFVRADVIGGLNAGATFDLIGDGEISDPNSYTGRIRAAEIANKLSTNPLDLFQLAGDLSAFLSAQVQLGIDLGFTQQWNTVWREELARIPIFQFGVGGSYGSGTASNGTLVGGEIYFDGDVDLKLDDDEPFTHRQCWNFILQGLIQQIRQQSRWFNHR